MGHSTRTRGQRGLTQRLHLCSEWILAVRLRTALLDRRQKRRIYAEQGVPHLWLVDPLVRSLEIFRLTEGGYTALGTFGEAEVVRAPPFEAIELELDALWPNPVTPLPNL
jgi:Uma2 family endonuclease